MSTAFAIDQELIHEALKLGHFKTQKDAINAALLEFVTRHKQTEAYYRASAILDRVHNGEEKTYSAEEVRKDLGLED